MWLNNRGHVLLLKMLAGAHLLFFCLLAGSAFAEEKAFADGHPLICATMQAIGCEYGEECQKGLPKIFGAPSFLRVDIQNKEIVGRESTTEIRVLHQTDEQITLQGIELGMGWTLAIDVDTGRAILTFANRETGIVIFGACTKL